MPMYSRTNILRISFNLNVSAHWLDAWGGRKDRMKISAVVLAAGQGKRMNTGTAKQYLLLKGKPVLFYALSAFEQSEVDEIVLVVGEDFKEYCKKEIVEKYHFKKIRAIVAGGSQRYHSVANGLSACGQCDIVLIHDGARPFVDRQMIHRAVEGAREHQACIVGMPVKDTIKIIGEDAFIRSTPNRRDVWMVQTPQAFRFELISEAYEQLLAQEEKLSREGVNITDDAMVVEYFTRQRIRIVEGSYRNIKITTPEDLQIAEIFLETSVGT